jgi:hypothetical protein
MSMVESPHRTPTIWPIVAYMVMIAGGVAAFLVIRDYGETLSAPAAVTAAGESSGSSGS